MMTFLSPSHQFQYFTNDDLSISFTKNVNILPMTTFPSTSN